MVKLGLPSFSKKKLIIAGFLLVLLIGIPLTVFVVQQQQQTQSGATQATTIALLPATKTVNVGDTIPIQVSLNPGGVNQVNFVKLVVTYDSNFLTPSSTSFTVDPASNLSILQGPTVDATSISVTLSVGSNFQNSIQTPTNIGTFSFVANAPTSGTPITPDNNQIQVRSLGSSDTATENVFLSGAQSVITILGTATPSASPTASPVALSCTLAANPTSVNVNGTSALTPTCQGSPSTYSWTTDCGTLASQSATTNTFTAPSAVPSGNICTVSLQVCDASNNCVTPTAPITVTQPAATATPTASPSPAPTAVATTNASPVCQSLTLNGPNSGTAPYAVTLTATGSDSDGTISKATFNFGDGSVQDVTDGAGSASMTALTSHTYSTAGTFTATATLTDNGGAVSNPSTCSQTITISGAAIAYRDGGG